MTRPRSANRWRLCCNSKGGTIAAKRRKLAREGMTLLGERTFDIVLLDLALSDKNGMDLLGEIHMLNPLQPGS